VIATKAKRKNIFKQGLGYRSQITDH